MNPPCLPMMTGCCRAMSCEGKEIENVDATPASDVGLSAARNPSSRERAGIGAQVLKRTRPSEKPLAADPSSDLELITARTATLRPSEAGVGHTTQNRKSTKQQTRGERLCPVAGHPKLATGRAKTGFRGGAGSGRLSVAIRCLAVARRARGRRLQRWLSQCSATGDAERLILLQA